MGTLPIIKGFRLRILPSENEHLRRFPVLVFIITLMIGIQVPMMSCSGGVSLARPYLFRDYEMLASYGPPQQHSSHHHNAAPVFHQQKSESPSYIESAEDVGSSEEGEQQYTAPVILDIDDPEEKARWLGLSERSSFEEDGESEEYYEDDEEQPRSLSSTEFSSRSSQQTRSSGETKPDKKNSGKKSGDDNAAGEESRGIMDNFSFNPFSYWQGDESEDDQQQGQTAELPQSDEIPEYAYYPYAYDASPTTDYYYDPSDPHQQQHDDQKKPIMPQLVPMQIAPPKPKPKPVSKQKPKPKPMTQKPKAKPKPKPKPPKPSGPPPGPKPPPLKIKRKKPQYSQQFHYQEFGKPDKLTMISEKLSKLNPFRYVQIQKPQIKIQKIPGDDPPPPGMHPMPPPQHMKRKKPKPQPPKKRKPPPTMMQTMMSKIKPKPQQPKPKQKKPKKPHGEEPNPEFVMIFGEPSGFGGYRPEDGEDYRDGLEDEEDDSEEDEEDDEDNEDEEGDDDDEEDLPQVQSITHETSPSGEMMNGEATFADDGEAAISNDDGEAESSQPQLVEDDEGDYEDGVIGLTGSNSGTSSGSSGSPGAETGLEEDDDQKEKSIKFPKLFGWRKKKRRRHRPKPARRPPNWKEYRPAPLINPEIPEGVSDAILKVVKHVGFLPEYDKTEKYGGHNKIKGKFTKTRPITLHHGLLTEVLRRRR